MIYPQATQPPTDGRWLWPVGSCISPPKWPPTFISPVSSPIPLLCLSFSNGLLHLLVQLLHRCWVSWMLALQTWPFPVYPCTQAPGTVCPQILSPLTRSTASRWGLVQDYRQIVWPNFLNNKVFERIRLRIRGLSSRCHMAWQENNWTL